MLFRGAGVVELGVAPVNCARGMFFVDFFAEGLVVCVCAIAVNVVFAAGCGEAGELVADTGAVGGVDAEGDGAEVHGFGESEGGDSQVVGCVGVEMFALVRIIRKIMGVDLESYLRWHQRGRAEPDQGSCPGRHLQGSLVVKEPVGRVYA